VPTGTRRTDARACVSRPARPNFSPALTLTASAARADDGLLYVGAGISKNKVQGITNAGVPFADINKTSWKVLAGFRPIKLFAVEVDYLDLGSQTNTFITQASTHSDAKAYAGYAVGFLFRYRSSTCSARRACRAGS
jgi:hypothetical protein